MPLPSDYNADERQRMLDMIRQAIRHGLSEGSMLPVDPSQYPAALQATGACFVTLHIGPQLRGCIGTLEAWRPLIVDIAANAHAAAFHDPRFAPLSESEFARLTIHLSILSPPEPMQFSGRADLLAQLRAGVDGLILQDHHHRSTFLPSVWEELTAPETFLQHLLVKAGLPPQHWSESLKAWRYQVISVE